MRGTGSFKIACGSARAQNRSTVSKKTLVVSYDPESRRISCRVSSLSEYDHALGGTVGCLAVPMVGPGSRRDMILTRWPISSGSIAILALPT